MNKYWLILISVMKKEIYPDVKLDPKWVDDYQGLYFDV